MEDNGLRDYKYKMDKVERYFSFLMIIIFFATFKGTLGFLVFTAFCVIVLTYYFKFYKNKPSYIVFNGDEIIASQGLTFKVKAFKTYDIDTVSKLENKIEVSLKAEGKIVLMKLLLSDKDYNEIFDELNRQKRENSKD